MVSGGVADVLIVQASIDGFVRLGYRLHFVTLSEQDAVAQVVTQVCPIRFGLVFRGGPMNWSKWVRQIHRWLSIAFTVTVIATFVALAQDKPVVWVSYVPLFPLALLLFTGLYLFVLPHATKWRSGRRTG
jgi:predicted Na+-dependent transporter